MRGPVAEWRSRSITLFVAGVSLAACGAAGVPGSDAADAVDALAAAPMEAGDRPPVDVLAADAPGLDVPVPPDAGWPPDAPAAPDAPEPDANAPDAGAAGFTALFDGVSLAGWHGDSAYWRAEGGEIIGATQGDLVQNTFLIHDTHYASFVLRLQFKLRNGNSGVNFRSEELAGFAMRGYQADIAEASYTGQLYEERGRGFLAPIDPAVVYPHIDLAGWNDYEITADGPHIVIAVNGFTTVDYREADPASAKEGLIGVQLHVGPAMEVRYRNLRIKPLP